MDEPIRFPSEMLKTCWFASLLPQLFVQSCRDDHGVRYEQVVPLVSLWSSSGGQVWFDDRHSGGHTSEFATRSLLLDAVHKMLNRESIKISEYKWNKKFRPYGLRTGIYLRGRRLLSRVQYFNTSIDQLERFIND